MITLARGQIDREEPAPAHNKNARIIRHWRAAERRLPVLRKMGVQIDSRKASDRSRTRTIAITKRLAAESCPKRLNCPATASDTSDTLGNSGEIQGALAHDGRPKLT
jgi:hypothetical protein